MYLRGKQLSVPIKELQDHAAPTVSVILPVNRHHSYLQPAIESILEQSFTAFELLVVAEVEFFPKEDAILQLGQYDPRIRVIPLTISPGLALALNVGIMASRGKYIARMDSDDLSMPDRLEVQVRFLDSHPDIVAVGARVALIDGEGKSIDRDFPFYETDAQIRRVLPIRNPMPHPVMTFRKSALVQAGSYRYSFLGEDWELFLRIVRNPAAKLHNLDQTLLQYRRHAAQETSTDSLSRAFIETSPVLFGEFLRTLSPKYLLGILLKTPMLLRIRNRLRPG
jgi:glycosyltransferase involved in cell wall biosynthesis